MKKLEWRLRKRKGLWSRRGQPLTFSSFTQPALPWRKTGKSASRKGWMEARLERRTVRLRPKVLAHFVEVGAMASVQACKIAAIAMSLAGGLQLEGCIGG